MSNYKGPILVEFTAMGTLEIELSALTLWKIYFHLVSASLPSTSLAAVCPKVSTSHLDTTKAAMFGL